MCVSARVCECTCVSARCESLARTGPSTSTLTRTRARAHVCTRALPRIAFPPYRTRRETPDFPRSAPAHNDPSLGSLCVPLRVRLCVCVSCVFFVCNCLFCDRCVFGVHVYTVLVGVFVYVRLYVCCVLFSPSPVLTLCVCSGEFVKLVRIQNTRVAITYHTHPGSVLCCWLCTCVCVCVCVCVWCVVLVCLCSTVVLCCCAVRLLLCLSV